MTEAFTAIALMLTLIIIVGVFVATVSISKTQNFNDHQTPDRPLSDEDREAINFLEVHSNLGLGVKSLLKKHKNSDQIYRFTNQDIFIRSISYRNGPAVYFFNIKSNGQSLEIMLPKVLKSYFEENETLYNVNFEIIFRGNICWLYCLEGRIGYRKLYEQFHFADGNTSFQVLSQRPTTAKEKNSFLFSKWSNPWVLIVGFMLPIIFFGLITIELALVVPMSIILPPFFYLTWKVAKKRKDYIDSREVYTLAGDLSYDDDLFVFKIGDKELKLHRKWKHALRTKKQWTGPVRIEAMMHTYDNWNEVAKQTFQPLTLTSDDLKLKESDIKSTRGWGMIAFYIAMLSPVLFIVEIDRIPSDFFYGLRANLASVSVSTIEDIYTKSLKNRQNISIKGLAIPSVSKMTNGRTGEPAYGLDNEHYFFPRKKMDHYRETLGLDKILLIKKEYERIEQGKRFISSFGGTVIVPLYQDKINNIFNHLNASNEILDKFKSYQALKRMNHNNFNLIIFNHRFEAFEKEVIEAILNLTDQTLKQLYKIEQNEEGIIARIDPYKSMRYLDIAPFLAEFPREEPLDGSLFLSDGPSSNHVVTKYRSSTVGDIIRMGIQMLLWLVLLFIVLYLLKLLIIRIKGNYFESTAVDLHLLE